MRFAASILAAAGLLASSAALAQAPQAAPSTGDPVLDDMLCFMVGGNPPPQANEQQRAAFLTMGTYYVGKLFGRDPNFDLAASAEMYGNRLENVDYGAQLQRCNQEFMEVGRRLQAFGNS